jgi:hypothetical protein
VSEEQEIDSDNDRCHSHHVKHDCHLSAHFSYLVLCCPATAALVLSGAVLFLLHACLTSSSAASQSFKGMALFTIVLQIYFVTSLFDLFVR